jgi:hypothetical protein
MQGIMSFSLSQLNRRWDYVPQQASSNLLTQESMFLNAFTDRNWSGCQNVGRKHRFAFDFIVAEPPLYIPGSGPPLVPVTVMLVHHKDGIIEGEISDE